MAHQLLRSWYLNPNEMFALLNSVTDQFKAIQLPTNLELRQQFQESFSLQLFGTVALPEWCEKNPPAYTTNNMPI